MLAFGKGFGNVSAELYPPSYAAEGDAPPVHVFMLLPDPRAERGDSGVSRAVQKP